jgi:hypothetical protein
LNGLVVDHENDVKQKRKSTINRPCCFMSKWIYEDMRIENYKNISQKKQALIKYKNNKPKVKIHFRVCYKTNQNTYNSKMDISKKNISYCKDHSVSKSLTYTTTNDRHVNYISQPSLDNLGSIMKVKIIFRIQMVNDRYLKKRTIL